MKNRLLTQKMGQEAVLKNKLRMPKLSFYEMTLNEIIDKNVTDNTVIVADDYNYPIIDSFEIVNNFRNSGLVVVKESSQEHIKEIKTMKTYDKIIAVGGCTALDFGRALAKPSDKIVLVPSILSTNCISVDRSVVYFNEEHETIPTPAPNKIIVSLPILMNGNENLLHKWSSSGFGDLFGNISAAINHVYDLEGGKFLKNGENIMDLILPLAPENFGALEWVLKHFEKFDRQTLKRLAVYLHNSSVDSIKRDDLRLSAAGEHDLYYTMLLQQKYSKNNPTHGELVTIGTLLTTKIIGKVFKQDTLYQWLKTAFKKLKLPTTYAELRSVGVEKDHIVTAMNALPNKNTFLNIYYEEKLLDECYNG